MRLTSAEFDRLADRAFLRIAPRFRKRLENVLIVVEQEPPRPGLLGLYHGRPMTQRSVFDLAPQHDTITIYQGPHERMSRTEAELEKNVTETLWHEIAHYFGMNERQVRTIERRRELQARRRSRRPASPPADPLL
ncbi:MAG: metallopeptidase family protein [Acidobacteria bacterium]|nr:metallopeptidase family protein [Acidobacteriota bacterium]